MSFSRWYPVSPYFYDPAIQPTKPIAKLQAKDEANNRKVPIGRYDTTYRREYLNFNNNQGSPQGEPQFPQPQYSQPQYPQPQYPQPQYTQPSNNSLNPYSKLPPINNGGPISQAAYQSHPINQAPTSYDSARKSPVPQPTYTMPIVTQMPQQAPLEYYAPPPQAKVTSNSDMDWPVEPIYPNPQDESTLIANIRRQLSYYSSAQLKSFYNELMTYDPTLSGFAHHSYISLTALRNSLPIDDSTLKYIMFKFVSPRHERGFVNYEEMVKYLAKCIGDSAPYLMSNPGPNQRSNSSMAMQPATYQPAPQAQSTYYTESGQPLTQAQVDHLFNSPNISQTYRPSSRNGRELDNFDPDEQAILRLMHENMRDWDQVNLINTDQLKRKFQEIDPHNTHILTLREIEDIVYKNRIPIQRSLIYQIVEKYCKITTGQYSWPAFVEFFDKLYNMQLLKKEKFHYTLRDETKANSFASEFKYRTYQLELLKSQTNEFERLETINQQIYDLQGIPQETHQRIDSRMGDVIKGETWFTRFMRLANAMYTHRMNSGTEFTLPKEEARRLITSYNQVYELKIPNEIIELGLTRCTLKGDVIIDDLLKVLAKVYNSSF